MLRGVSVPLDGVVELGDVVLQSGATIRGVLVVGKVGHPRASSCGVHRFVPARQVSYEIDNVDGKFELAGLEPGNYTLSWSRPTQDTWIDDDPRRVPVPLAEGEVREVTLDARGSEPCKIIVHVRRGEKPVRDMRVSVRIRSATKPDNEMTTPLGTTGPDGVVSGEVDGDLVFELVAETEAGQVLGTRRLGDPRRAERPHRADDRRHGAGTPRRSRSARAGRRARAGRNCAPAHHRRSKPMYLLAQTPAMLREHAGTFPWTGERIPFGECQAGEYDAVVKIYR